MAKIRPFCAWRYNETMVNSISDLTSPLFDVITQEQRSALYQNPYNSIHLSVPPQTGAPDKAHETITN